MLLWPAADGGRATGIGASSVLAVPSAPRLALRALPGGEAFGLRVARAWNPILWGALLAIGAFAFFHILINPTSGYRSDTSRTPLFTTLPLLVGFSLVSVALWAPVPARGFVRFTTPLSVPFAPAVLVRSREKRPLRG